MYDGQPLSRPRRARISKAFTIDPAKTGTGPVTLQVIGVIAKEGVEQRIASEPIRIEIPAK